MSIDEINSQISAKQDEITKIEEEAAKKNASAEKEVEAEYDSQISGAESKLVTEQGLLDEAIEKANEWAATKKEKAANVKALSKEVAGLKKAKTAALKTKLKEISSEEKASVKAVQGEIKGLQKQLKAIEKQMAMEE
ncbi:MAG: hypothetical protein ACFFAS_15340 [Promethearchaeota archaeon]